MTFVGRGYDSKIEDPDTQHTDTLSKKIVTRVSGPGNYHVGRVLDCQNLYDCQFVKL